MHIWSLSWSRHFASPRLWSRCACVLSLVLSVVFYSHVLLYVQALKILPVFIIVLLVTIQYYHLHLHPASALQSLTELLFPELLGDTRVLSSSWIASGIIADCIKCLFTHSSGAGYWSWRKWNKVNFLSVLNSIVSSGLYLLDSSFLCLVLCVVCWAL